MIISCSEREDISTVQIDCSNMKEELVAAIDNSLASGQLNSDSASEPFISLLSEIDQELKNRFLSCTETDKVAAMELGKTRAALSTIKISVSPSIKECGENNAQCVYKVISHPIAILNSQDSAL